MGVIARLLPWKDKYYLTQDNDKGGTGQNGVRFTGHSTRSLLRKKEMTSKEHLNIIDAVLACELEDGLLFRDPSRGGGQEGPDNIYANHYIDSVLKTGFSRRWLKRGREQRTTHFDEAYYKNHNKEKKWWHKPLYYLLLTLSCFRGIKYNYNTDVSGGWNPSAWIGRQLSMLAQAKWVAGEWMVHRFDLKVWFFCGIILGALNGESQDGKVLAWFTIMSVEPKINWLTNPLIKLSFVYWRWMLKRQWGPDGIGAVLNKYWNGNGHPDIELLKRDFGEILK